MNGGAILLAAGSGRRFGSDKRLYPMADQQPMLLVTLTTYLQAFDHIIVVLREADTELANHVQRTALHNAAQSARSASAAVECVFCRDADLGMGHSLAAGAACAADWDYLFVGLADMPFVRPATLVALRNALLTELARSGPDAIVEPVFVPDAPPHDPNAQTFGASSQHGHPVGFGSAYLAALTACKGDVGARALLRQHADRVTRVPVTDRGVLLDVDQPEHAQG